MSSCVDFFRFRLEAGAGEGRDRLCDAYARRPADGLMFRSFGSSSAVCRWGSRAVPASQRYNCFLAMPKACSMEGKPRILE